MSLPLPPKYSTTGSQQLDQDPMTPQTPEKPEQSRVMGREDPVSSSLPGLAALQTELYAEAVAASASRLVVQMLSIGRLSALLDLHVSEGSRHLPFAIDTCR